MKATLPERFYTAFLEGDRWKLYLQGVASTLELTVIALILGILLGLVVAVIRTAHDQQRLGRKRNPLLGIMTRFLWMYGCPPWTAMKRQWLSAGWNVGTPGYRLSP